MLELILLLRRRCIKYIKYNQNPLMNIKNNNRSTQVNPLRANPTKNCETHSNKSPAKAGELIECVWPFCSVDTQKAKDIFSWNISNVIMKNNPFNKKTNKAVKSKWGSYFNVKAKSTENGMTVRFLMIGKAIAGKRLGLQVRNKSERAGQSITAMKSSRQVKELKRIIRDKWVIKELTRSINSAMIDRLTSTFDGN